MLLLLGGLVGLVAGLLTGGRIGRLADIRFRHPWVVLVAYAARELDVLYTPLAHSWLSPLFYTAALAALAIWTLLHRDRVPGIWLVAVGMVMNFTVVAANLGHMPVPLWLATRGPHELIEKGFLGQYVLESSSTRLNFLDDWVALPGTLGRIFPQAYSPGDLVAVVGMAVSVFLSMRPRAALTTR